MCFSFLIWSLLLTVGLFAGGWYMRSMWLAFWNPMGGVNFFLMRLFRDVSRAKARRRRFGQKGALMTLLRGTEEPLPLGDADAGIRITAEELAEFDGRELESHGEGDATHAPLYIAVMGRIYDVSGGKRFYGRGNSYHKLVGKDPTRAFCTGCLEPDCLIPWTDGLRDDQVAEAHKWMELYEHHDNYKLVGRLREDNLAEGEPEDGTEADAAEWELKRKAMLEEQQARREGMVELSLIAEGSAPRRLFRPR